MRGRKRRSGSTRNNQTENGSARLRLRWSLDMRRGPWKVSEETQERLANSCPLQSKLCYFGAEMLATAMFPRRGVRACAKRCAANSCCKNRSATTRPPRPQPPDHTTTKQLMPVFWQHEWAHGCSSCGCSTGTSRPSDVPPTLSSELGACWNYPSWSPSLELLDRCSSARPSDRRTIGPCPFVRVRSGDSTESDGTGNPESCPGEE